MKKGDKLRGFEILDIVDLEELKAEGIWARHNSGAEVFHVVNDDEENLFGFAFSTAPDDSTGVAHILEHSVLCGSEKYPLKDAFLVLAQGSLQTFLNAWTFPDKTVYPASSTNEKDYFNLMSVYADAVFHPLLSEWTFMQEGWRLNLSKKGLEYTGVVYNEMKGAYSSMDTFAGHWSLKAVLPGTPYAFESGGDPDCIPALSLEQLKEFHRSRYTPANCRVFLAGNIPTEKQLAFLDAILSKPEPGRAAPAVPKAKPWKESALLRIPCPGTEKPQAVLSWLCGDSVDTAETMAIGCLSEILLGHDGSPLTRILVESGLGEDLSASTGLEAELRETVFSAGLRGIIAEKGKTEETCRRMEKLILDELARLSKEGIPKEETEAALLNMEFSHREIKRAHGPYSLVWMRRALRTWLHGTPPWKSLLFNPGFSELKRRLDGKRFFESLIEKLLLNNPHRALVIIEAEDDYLEKKEAELKKQLNEKEKSLSKTEKDELKKKNAALEKIQSEKESQEALDSIPHLLRTDLKAEIVSVPALFTKPAAAGNSAGTLDVPCIYHPLFTNGISYAELAFPVDVLKPEDYPWLPFFARSVVSMGLPGMDYGEVSSLLARTVGGFYAMLETGSAAPQSVIAPQGAAGSLAENIPAEFLGRDWIIYRIKALDEKFASALDLARRLITEADFSDLRRLRDLALEMKNDADSSLAPTGHSYASGRSGKFFSRSRAVDELWNGIGQIPFSHKLAAMEPEELKARMTGLRDTLAKGGVFCNITASEEAVKGALKAAETMNSFGSPANANPLCGKKESFFALMENKKAEVFASPSLQIGFAAMSLPASPYCTREQAAELAFSHELSTGELWESIRMMRGAYGAFAHPDNLEGVFSFSTYRDPEPVRSLELFPEILKKRSEESIDADSLDKVIIGAYARITRPQSPIEKGFAEFLRRLYGINDDHRVANLKHLIALAEEDTNAVARRLCAAAKNGEAASCPVIIAGKKAAESAAKKFNTDIQELPI
jgi:Zn-dependent M16 (insulinase) family peptidase